MMTRQPTKEEEEADPDWIVQIGSNRRAEHVDQDPTILPPTKEGTADQGKVRIKDKKEKGKEVEALSEEERRRWKIECLKRAVKSARGIYKNFLYDEDQNELQEIDASINKVDPDNVDGVTLAHLMKRIELFNHKAKKQSDAYNLKEKDHVSKVLQTGLNEEAKGRHAEAKRTAAEAQKVNELVSDFYKNIIRLKQQQDQVPTENIKQKMDMGLRFLEVLEPMEENLLVARQNYHDFVTIVDEWNKEHMADTFWDHSPSNDSHPPPEPRNAGGSDSQGAAGGNDKKPPQDGGGKSTVSSILSLQGVATCSNIIGPTASEEISTDFSRMKGVINDLLGHHREVDLVKDRLFAIASSAMRSKLTGQPLVEVLSVCTNSPFVKCISIYDNRSGKVVYNSKDSDAVRFFEKRESWLLLHPEMESSDYMERLVITGPGRAMSALAGFVIEVDVDDPEGVFDLSCSWEDTPCVDKPMSQTIFTSRGEVLVTSAVMSNAVQASIEFMLVSPLFSSRTSILVFGQLAIQIENFSTSIFMFFNHERRPSVDQCVEWEDEDFDEGLVGKVPLTRNVFALPADRGFRVTGHLFLSNEDTKVYIDQYVEAKHLLGELCIWPVHTKRPRGVRQVRGSHAGKIHKHVHLPPVTHAAIRIKTTCPF